MDVLIPQLNFLLALGTVLLQVAIVVLLAVFFFKRESSFLKFSGVYGVHIVFAVSLGGLLMSLLYSEVFGFVPCGLCWLQRVFLYPQVILSGLALMKRDHRIADYLIGLSIPGFLVGLYQHYLQMGGSELIDCPAAGADCAKRILFEFGYITYPLMSVTLFAFIIALMVLHKEVYSLNKTK